MLVGYILKCNIYRKGGEVEISGCDFHKEIRKPILKSKWMESGFKLFNLFFDLQIILVNIPRPGWPLVCSTH